jgi:spermidine synthase
MAPRSRPVPDAEPAVVDRVQTPRGELVLRRRGDIFEIISNGVFAMDSADGGSERLLAERALADLAGRRGLRVLVAGLGIGYTLRRVLDHAEVEHVTVVEIEDVVVGWNRGPLVVVNADATRDPRVRVVVEDIVAWLDTAPPGERFDAICLDVDNGPDWTLFEQNRRLYGTDVLRLLRNRLRPGGILAVWSSTGSAWFEQRLRAVFGEVERYEHAARNGPPDVVWTARAVSAASGGGGPAPSPPNAPGRCAPGNIATPPLRALLMMKSSGRTLTMPLHEP